MLIVKRRVKQIFKESGKRLRRDGAVHIDRIVTHLVRGLCGQIRANVVTDEEIQIAYSAQGFPAIATQGVSGQGASPENLASVNSQGGTGVVSGDMGSSATPRRRAVRRRHA